MCGTAGRFGPGIGESGYRSDRSYPGHRIDRPSQVVGSFSCLVPPPLESVTGQDVEDFPVSRISECVGCFVGVAGGEEVIEASMRHLVEVCQFEAFDVPPAPAKSSGLIPPLGLCHHHT